MGNCPICNSNAEISSPGGLDGEVVSCLRCGDFKISRTAIVNLRRHLADDERIIANASGWIREHQNELINSVIAATFETLKMPSVIEKADRLLKALVDKSYFFGIQVTIDRTDLLYSTNNQIESKRIFSLELIGVAWALHYEELSHLLTYLEEEQLLVQKAIPPYINVTVSAKGFAYIEHLKYAVSASMQGFCAMWFDDSIKSLWTQAISPAISDAGYEPKRIDEHQHNNRIDDEIIAQIRRSKFVVADFTEQRGGVYFEAGFALGMNLPVIWTVKESELANVHFDNRQSSFSRSLRSSQQQNHAPLRGSCLINWIPACAGMTDLSRWA